MNLRDLGHRHPVDTFETEEARQAHIDGEIPKALGEGGDDLLASSPEIKPIEILAVK